jgi:uncharacterized LabA/DUF88 family protein
VLSYAILIDGGFLKRKLGTPKAPATLAHIQVFLDSLKHAPALTSMRLHRVYFYDSQPLVSVEEKPLNGGRIDFGAHPAATRNQQLHAELVQEPFMALRLGELAFRGWRLNRRAMARGETEVTISESDLQPEIQQKGVDMRIGLDIAALTLKKQADVIVLVTGDSDFVPAMKFARREGAQLYLVPLGHSIKDSMREHSDLVINI